MKTATNILSLALDIALVAVPLVMWLLHASAAAMSITLMVVGVLRILTPAKAKLRKQPTSD
jgi:hypothetical protein